jgi:simple sugar transport system ATP-binding protein
MVEDFRLKRDNLMARRLTIIKKIRRIGGGLRGIPAGVLALRNRMMFWRRKASAREFRIRRVKHGEIVIEMKGITKRFPGVVANDRIDFDVRAGEIHALLGENGAGKTTLMNILYGLYRPDRGEIKIHGRKVDIKSPQDAIDLNIGMVHQLFKQVERHTVAENIALVASSGFFSPVEKVKGEILRLSKEYGWKVDPEAGIWQLSASERQKVEILKAIFRGAKILILDEPTSVLTPQGKRELFSRLLEMKEKGYAIVFITHKLDEVMQISDRVTVLRKGKKVRTLYTKKTDKKHLARLMVGREVLFRLKKKPVKKGKIILEVKNLRVLGDREETAVDNVSLIVREGEILGIAGVGGSGQRELVEALTGLRKVQKGRIFISGRDLTNAPPRRFIDMNVSHVPADRHRGLVFPMSVEENLILKDYRYPPFSKRVFLNQGVIRHEAEKKVSQYDIITSSLNAPVALLSGGNLQRVILARETSRELNLLIAAYPTYGLDVGSTESIRKLLLEQRRAGKAILLISEDLDEIMMLSDRIAVMFEGKIVGTVDAAKTRREEIGMMMAGISRGES